jgi:hypothetical protein
MGKSNFNKVCGDKSAYETEEEAWASSDYLYENEGLDLNVYKCPICNKYHLTSKWSRK